MKGDMSASTGVTSDRPAARQSMLRRHWWILIIIVLAVLVAIIYVLSHLSAADSEMYPTTMLPAQQVRAWLC